MHSNWSFLENRNARLIWLGFALAFGYMPAAGEGKILRVVAIDPAQLGLAECAWRFGQFGQQRHQQPLVIIAIDEGLRIFDGRDHAGTHGVQRLNGNQ